MRLDLSLRLTDRELRECISRYHFTESDRITLAALQEAVLPLLKPRAYYASYEGEQEVACIVTLGEGLDLLQELYMREDALSEAYMLDCLGASLLQQAYEDFVAFLQKDKGRYVEKLIFLGEEYPLTLTPKLIALTGAEVHSSEDFVLTPRKSVSLILPMTDHPVEGACHICRNCRNVTCSLRKYDNK